MACCAFAFFLVSQILWPLRWIRAHIPLGVRNDAVSWSPEAAAAEPRPSLALASTGALVIAATLMLGSLTQLTPAHAQLCTTHAARGN